MLRFAMVFFVNYLARWNQSFVTQALIFRQGLTLETYDLTIILSHAMHTSWTSARNLVVQKLGYETWVQN